MEFQEWLKKVQVEMSRHISTRVITLLCELDNKVNIIKEGRYKYWKNQDTKYESALHTNSVYRFLNQLDEDKLYIIIPFITINNKSNEPYIILSQQILVTNKSNALIITLYLNSKIDSSINLYEIHDLEEFYVTFKYKEIEVKWESYKDFK